MPVGLTVLHCRSCIYVCVSDIKRGSGLVWCGVVRCGVDHQGSEVGKRERVCVEKEALGPCVRACMPCDYDMFVQKFVEERCQCVGADGREE